MGLFKKKTEIEKEEEIEKSVIENNLAIKKKETTAKVIRYVVPEDSEVPSIVNICDFHADILPEKDSIIWAPNEQQTKLIPYKVLRYDFIEDIESDLNTYLYIVVKPATISEIATFDIY